MKSFHWRSFAALTAGLCLIVAGVTGFLLYNAPPGRYGHGAGLLIWGISKRQLLHVHTLMAMLMVTFSLWHICFNWAILVRYLKDRNRRILILAPELAASLLLVAFVLFFG